MTEADLEMGRPVPELDIEFEWHGGLWKQLFDKNVHFIQQDILRALADDKMVVYLSCPLSSRAGSYFATNVEIANFTARRLLSTWGSRTWFLNPAQYQMESAQGLGLIRMHAYQLGLELHTTIDLDELLKEVPAVGGDYMRMWTRVLAEDDDKQWGNRFSAFHFLGPSDVRAFFSSGTMDFTTGVESYFARRFAIDSSFRDYFSLPFKEEKGNTSVESPDTQLRRLESRKEEFVRYYTMRASVHFSKGCHDEWNIWQKLNALRRDADEPNEIAGYFEGMQIPPSSAETPVSAGYALSKGKIATSATLYQTAKLTASVERLSEYAHKDGGV
jgi:hypothetical protein